MDKTGKMEKVMHEFKHGKLRSSSGAKVTNRKQAIAIALSEAQSAKIDRAREAHKSKKRKKR